jgi:hypothetical protein
MFATGGHYVPIGYWSVPALENQEATLAGLSSALADYFQLLLASYGFSQRA